MLNELWNAEVAPRLSVVLDKLSERFESELIVDNSEYVYVDGEEGDYGKVYYRTEDNELLFTKIIEGGDREYWEVTPGGYARLVRYMGYALSEVIEAQMREAGNE